MPSTFTLITDASLDAATLFERSLSIDRHLESMAHSQEQAIAGVTSGQIGLGEQVTWRARHFGIWFTMTSTITAHEPPHRFVDEQVRGPFKSFTHEHVFLDTDAGGRMIDTITLVSPVLGWVVEPLILIPYLRRLIKRRNLALI